MASRFVIGALTVVLGACATSAPTSSRDAGRDGNASDRGADLAPDVGADLGADLPSSDSAIDIAMDAGGDGSRSDGPSADAATPAYITVRGLYHMHSPYSHDACDGEGLIGGQPNAPCLAQLRAAICANGFDFVFLTDHPSNMKSYTMEQDMLFDVGAGDQLMLDGGKPIANAMSCGAGVTKRPLISVGFESLHMMPLGLHSLPVDSTLYSGIDDNTPINAVQAQVTALEGLGAVSAMVHSEESDISASTIDAAGFDAMEWYNIHANFVVLLGKDGKLSADLSNIPALTALVQTLGQLDAFISGGASGPHPDLVFLLLLDKAPPAGFDKWRAVQKTRPITGLLGSDIHRNVSVDTSMCAGPLQQLVCAGALALVESGLGITLPGAIKSLVLQGGTIALSDGDRIDSYDRLMRWMENRVLVKTVDQLAIQQSIRQGRAYGVFAIFGDPLGFSFTGSALGATLALGDKASGPVTLRVAAPTAPGVMRGASFTPADAAKAEISVELFRTDASGTKLVGSANALGAVLVKQVSQPGAYHVEVRIRPKHLTAALAGSAGLAQKQFLWLITNPIFVTP